MSRSVILNIQSFKKHRWLDLTPDQWKHTVSGGGLGIRVFLKGSPVFLMNSQDWEALIEIHVRGFRDEINLEMQYFQKAGWGVKMPGVSEAHVFHLLVMWSWKSLLLEDILFWNYFRLTRSCKGNTEFSCTVHPSLGHYQIISSIK